MDGLDKFEQLVADASVATAILYNPATGDSELVPLEPVEQDTARIYTARGLAFAGVLGLVDGTPHIVLAVPLEGEAAQRILTRFTERLEAEINARVPEAESVSWLRRLWSLKDTRGTL